MIELAPITGTENSSFSFSSLIFGLLPDVIVINSLKFAIFQSFGLSFCQ
jgi:hypothetical protein